MNEIILGLLLIAFLILLIMLPNIKIIRENEVVIVERLGKFYKLVEQKGVLITIPFVERIYETMSLLEQNLNVKNNYFSLNIVYKINDPKLFSYAHLNSIKQFSSEIELLKEINDDILQNIANNYGLLIINNNLVYNMNKEE